MPRSPPRHRFAALIVPAVALAFSIVVAAVLWFSHPKRFGIHFQIDATSFDIVRPASGPAVIPFAHPVQLNTAIALDMPVLQSLPALEIPANIDGAIALSGDMLLDTVAFNDTQTIRLSNSTGCLSLSSLDRHSLGVSVRARSASAILVSRGKWTTHRNGPLASFDLAGRGEMLCMNTGQTLSLPPLDRVGTETDQVPAGDSTSTAQGGTVTLDDLNRTIELRAGESFTLEGFDNYAALTLISATDSHGAGLRLAGAGSVRDMTLGAPGKETEVRPRYFEELQQTQFGVGGLLFALATCWGIVWGAISFVQERLK